MECIWRITCLEEDVLVVFPTGFDKRRLIKLHRPTELLLWVPWGPFLESPGNFSGPESYSKISNLTITELFYSHIFNMNRDSLHTRSFRRIRFSFLDTDELKMALRARKVYGAFEKRAPGVCTKVTSRKSQEHTLENWDSYCKKLHRNTELARAVDVMMAEQREFTFWWSK